MRQQFHRISQQGKAWVDCVSASWFRSRLVVYKRAGHTLIWGVQYGATARGPVSLLCEQFEYENKNEEAGTAARTEEEPRGLKYPVTASISCKILFHHP